MRVGPTATLSTATPRSPSTRPPVSYEWYFQHIPGDSHDMDETFERILIDYDGRSSVFSMGKLGILWELDRITGDYVNATDLGLSEHPRRRPQHRERSPTGTA